MGGIGYITEFSLELFTLHPDFITSTLTMNILTSGTDDIISESGMTISSITSESVSAISYSNQLMSLTVDDLYYQNLDQSVSASENYDMQIALNLSWSASSTSSILHSITEYNGNTIPSWISIDLSSGVQGLS